MTVIDVSPIFLTDSTIQIDVDDFAAAISSATFSPSSKTVTWQGLKSTSQFTFQPPATWTLDLQYAQDLSNADSLSHYLHEHEGESKPAVFIPSDGSDTVTAMVFITPGALGGGQGGVASSKVSLGVQGKPELTPAGS